MPVIEYHRHALACGMSIEVAELAVISRHGLSVDVDQRSPHCPPTVVAGLGDYAALSMSALGLTKARAQAVAQAVGIADCGCRSRQQLLNELGRRLGVGRPPDFNDPPPGPQSTS